MRVAAINPLVDIDDTGMVIVDDREWVAKQFARIMNASGFGDRVVAGTMPRLPGDDVWLSIPLAEGMHHHHEVLGRMNANTRVRSPPLV